MNIVCLGLTQIRYEPVNEPQERFRASQISQTDAPHKSAFLISEIIGSPPPA